MKNLLALTLLLTTAFTALQAASDLYLGDGGQGKSLAILVPEGKNLTNDETYLPDHIQGRFVSDLKKFSAMDVEDRLALETVLRENESGIYAEGQNDAELGKIAGKDYYLSGTLTKTASAFALRVQINNTITGNTEASYSGSCTVQELDNFTAVKKASLELLTQMKIQLTPKAREELLEAGSEQEIRRDTTLAKGITALRSNQEILGYSLITEAYNIDPSSVEAAGRYNILTANISSGDIGENARNDIVWRRNWVARLTECEQYYTDYVRAPLPFYLVYTTDLQTGEINYANETMPFSFTISLNPMLPWLDTIESVVNTVRTGLTATGRASTWKLNWPETSAAGGTSPFTGRKGTVTVAVDLVNQNGVTIGSQRIALAYEWGVSFQGSPIFQGRPILITPKADIEKKVTFSAVKADLITDRLTIKVASIDGVAAETAAGSRRITILTEGEYNRLPEVIAGNDYSNTSQFTIDANGMITDYKARDAVYIQRRPELGVARYTGSGGNVIIPSRFKGKPVTSIGDGAFRDKQLTSVTIPNSVTSIGRGAFQNNQLTSVIIPDSVTSIRGGGVSGGAFSNNRLTSVILSNSLTSIGAEVFENNLLTAIIIPNSVKEIGYSAFFRNENLSHITIPRRVRIEPLPFSSTYSTFGYDGVFEKCYFSNESQAGIYTRAGDFGSYVWSKQ